MSSAGHLRDFSNFFGGNDNYHDDVIAKCNKVNLLTKEHLEKLHFYSDIKGGSHNKNIEKEASGKA